MSEEIDEVEILAPMDDAYLRLACFKAVSELPIHEQRVSVIQAAQALYNWVMNYEDQEQEEPGSRTTEEQCTRKH